jgi:hypothetical protein
VKVSKKKFIKKNCFEMGCVASVQNQEKKESKQKDEPESKKESKQKENLASNEEQEQKKEKKNPLITVSNDTFCNNLKEGKWYFKEESRNLEMLNFPSVVIEKGIKQRWFLPIYENCNEIILTFFLPFDMETIMLFNKANFNAENKQIILQFLPSWSKSAGNTFVLNFDNQKTIDLYQYVSLQQWESAIKQGYEMIMQNKTSTSFTYHDVYKHVHIGCTDIMNRNIQTGINKLLFSQSLQIHFSWYSCGANCLISPLSS